MAYQDIQISAAALVALVMLLSIFASLSLVVYPLMIRNYLRRASLERQRQIDIEMARQSLAAADLPDRSLTRSPETHDPQEPAPPAYDATDDERAMYIARSDSVLSSPVSSLDDWTDVEDSALVRQAERQMAPR